ncbi:MAG: hypothetical protein ACR2OR_17780 [Hyphomicrobiales bacterium]
MFVPAGHFYSPIQSEEEIRTYSHRLVKPHTCQGLNMKVEGQLALVDELAEFYDSMPFEAQKSAIL